MQSLIDTYLKLKLLAQDLQSEQHKDEKKLLIFQSAWENLSP